MLRVNDLDCSALQKDRSDSASLPCDASGGLELHRAALHFIDRRKSRKSGAQLRWCLFYVSLYVAVYCLSLNVWYGLLQLCVFLSVPLLRLYNGTRGKSAALDRVMKPLFYAYYPLHLFILGLLRAFL